MPLKDRSVAVRIVCNELNHLGMTFNPPLFAGGNPRDEVETQSIKTLFSEIDDFDQKNNVAEPRVDRFVHHLGASIPWHFELSPSDLIDEEFDTIGDLVDEIMDS